MAGIVWLASYPSSGSTWLRVLLQNILADDGAPIDINKLDKSHSLTSRLWLDDVLGIDTAELSERELAALRPVAMRQLAAQNERLFIKIHDAYPDAGIAVDVSQAAIYIVRNPLDVAHSYAAHLGRDIEYAIGCMADPASNLTELPMLLRPNLRQHLGRWSDHVVGWLDNGSVPVTLVRYEDLHAASVATLARAFDFVGIRTELTQLEAARARSRFEAVARQEDAAGFREKPSAAQRFFRRGEAGAWRELLTPRQVDRIISDHGPAMQRLGYLDDRGAPVHDGTGAIAMEAVRRGAAQ